MHQHDEISKEEEGEAEKEEEEDWISVYVMAHLHWLKVVELGGAIDIIEMLLPYRFY